MKTGLLTLIALFFGFFAFSQDLLGFQTSQIQKTTQGTRGIQVQSFGDSSLEVMNKYAERYFKFKLDPATGICYQEDVQLSKNDFENLHILQRFLSPKNQIKITVNEEDAFDQTSLKTIQIKHEGENIHLTFKLKVSPSELMAIRNEQDNN